MKMRKIRLEGHATVTYRLKFYSDKDFKNNDKIFRWNWHEL